MLEKYKKIIIITDKPLKKYSSNYFIKRILNIVLISFFVLLINLIPNESSNKSLLIKLPKVNKNELISRNYKKKIFSFWEPREKIPGYLQLCIKTWKKYLPQYELIILDYKSTKKYIGNDIFNSIVDKKMPLPIQADAIRVALLKKYGGIWLDTDIIITNGVFLKNLEKYELVMLGKNNSQHIGFIIGSSNSILLKEWLNEIIKRVNKYKKDNIKLNNGTKKVIWKYLGNDIFDKLIKSYKDNKYYLLNKDTINAFPEKQLFMNNSINYIKRYREFYFKKRDPEIVLNHTKGIIYLHNSWTPFKYKNMTEKEFLKQDILLSRLLIKILNIKL